MFCQNCNTLSDEKRCPVCGNRDMRMPAPGDYCFLTEQDQIWAGMLSDVLEQNSVAFITRSLLGAGITAKIGPIMERVRFYVPYSAYENAQSIVTELFDSATYE